MRFPKEYRKTQKKTLPPQQDARTYDLELLNLRDLIDSGCVPPSSVLPIISLGPGMFLLSVWPVVFRVFGYTNSG
jgi:hypothetical protein